MTGTAIGLFVVAAVVLALGVFVLVMAIRAMASRDEPDISVSASTGQSAQVGRGGLVIFLVLGAGAIVLGIVVLVGAIRALG